MRGSAMAASDVVVGTGQGPVRGSCAAGIRSFEAMWDGVR
jgi:hypothetical protein